MNTIQMKSLAFFTAFFISAPAIAATSQLSALDKTGCVRIYYDASPNPSYKLGQTYAILLSNLIGHFPKIHTLIKPVEFYQKGEIQTCQTTFYIGSYFGNKLSEQFLFDFANSDKTVVWMKHSLWEYSEKRLSRIFGVKYNNVTTLSWDNKDSFGKPGFFKYIDYKGERFTKYGEFKPGSTEVFNSAFDMVALKKEANAPEIIAEATHSTTGEKLPYIIKKKNRYFIADVPFSFIHERDRYLVFTDLLFDLLNAKESYPGKKPAIFRIEDISSATPQLQLQALADILHEYKIPFLVSLIPVFTDPLQKTRLGRAHSELGVDQDPKMVDAIQKLKDKGAQFVWHGVTHQYGKNKNPFSGLSGEDFEFWDSVKNTPLQEDSPEYILNRLDQAWNPLFRLGINPVVWETPHYKASILDQHIFANLFPWNIGRPLYAVHEVSGLDKSQLTENLWYQNSGFMGSQLRRQVFSAMKVTESGPTEGQYFPFEIYGDHYGQRVFPENLGFPPLEFALEDSGPHNIDEIIENVKRNRVLRDNWGSLFFHIGYLIDPKEGFGKTSEKSVKKLRELIETMLSHGYEFIDVQSFSDSHKTVFRIPPVFQTDSSIKKGKSL